MRLIVDGMTCDHCVRVITKAIHAINPDARVKVDLADCTVNIEGDVDPALAMEAIESQGYHAVLAIGEPKACCGTCHA